MSERPPWAVLASHEDPSGARCVDIFQRPDGSWGFEAYRRDPEEARWTPAGGYAALCYPGRAEAEAAARAAQPWRTV